MQLLKEDGTEVVHRGELDKTTNQFAKGDDYGVCPINQIAHSIFSSVELTANDLVICPEPNYPYKAHFTSLCTYSNETKNGWLQDLSGYRIDTPGLFDNEGNAALEWGSDKQCRNSKLFRVVAYPCIDIFQSGRLIPNMVSLKMNWHRASNEFCIMNVKTSRTTKYKLKVHKAIFHLKRCALSADTFMEIERNLAGGANLLYPVKSMVIKPSSIAQGLTSKTLDTCFSNQYIPERLLIAFVDQKGFTGSADKNPFNLQHFEIADCTVDVLGQTYRQTFEWDDTYKQNGTIVPYLEYIRLLSQKYPDDSQFGLSKNDYENGNFIICFDLSQDAAYRTGNSSAGVKGNIVVNIRFSKSLLQPITMLAIGIYDNMFMCSVDRSFSRPYIY